MIKARLAKLRAAMSARGLDAVLVHKPENQAYLSGFTGGEGVLLITAAHCYLITDFRYTEQAAAEAPDFTVLRLETTAAAVVAQQLADEPVKRVGFEGDYLTVDTHRTYQEALGQWELCAATGLIERLRMVKDAGELALMRQAAAIADQAFAEILPLIKPGVKERDLAAELEYRMKRLGAEGPSFETIVASGVRSSLPHGRASDKAIEPGDFVTFDFGAIYQGYCSDMTRTVVVGEPTEKQREIYAIVLEAQKRGVAACRAGLTGKELDAVCRGYIGEKGYADAFGHGTGHGVGRFIHEGPKVSLKGENDRLEAGMVVTIEPGIYLPGWGGVRIEDMVLVTETGCEPFTKTPKDLLIL